MDIVVKRDWCFEIMEHRLHEEGYTYTVSRQWPVRRFACCRCKDIVYAEYAGPNAQDQCPICGHLRCEIPDAVVKLPTWE